MSEDLLIDKVKTICKKKPNERSLADITDLQNLTFKSKVFKNISELSGEAALQICCKFLSYEFCPANSYLFNAGDLGTCFYTLISGKVSIEIPIVDERTGETHYKEVVEISKGESFGELALESSKPRAASAKCKENSHFLTLEKIDYNRMIAKIVRDKRNNVVNFLKTLPIFSGITKGSIAKLTYNFKEKDFTKGQTVYKEGDVVNDVFLVTEGEFVFQKRIKVEDGRKKKGLYNQVYTDSVEIARFRSKGLEKKLVQVGTVSKIGIGELFGVEENDGELRKFTCLCSSSKAKVLFLPKSDFYKRVKGEDALVHIKQKIEVREEEIDSRVCMWKTIAENTASSLSPLQLRRKEQELATLRERGKTPPPLIKSSTTQCFSKKQDNFSNEFLHKLVKNELMRSGSPIDTQKKNLKFSEKNEKTSVCITNSAVNKVKALERILRAENTKVKNFSPNLGSECLTMYSMNSKAIYKALK